MTVRSRAERIADARRRLAFDPNVWIATASPDGVPHVVPLSLAWIDEAIVVTTPTDTPTVRNALATGRARACLDSASDVVVIDGAITGVDLQAARAELLDAYVERVGWDPRDDADAWTLLTLAPRRVQAWNGVAEMSGRTLMRDGVWTA